LKLSTHTISRLSISAAVALAALLVGGAARAQSGGASTGPTAVSSTPSTPGAPGSMGFSSAAPLLEHPIEGAAYSLGPGDVLGLAIQGTVSRFHELDVSPEGTVLVPGASEVRVAGLSLDDARTEIRREVARAFRNVQVTVTLLRLRRFTIFVLGQVHQPGQYTASPVDRVSEGIRLAGGLVTGLEPGGRPLDRGSERSIDLIHQDGERVRSDLLRFRRTGDLSSNPSVRDGDVILVGFSRSGVLVNGEVHSPGEIEYAPGDSLGPMLDLAGGPTERAWLDTLLIARYLEGSATPQRIALYGGTPSAYREARAFPLEERDAILVRARPDWDVRHTTEVKGEVRYPGKYVIDEAESTLLELIERAGGFTIDANLRESQLLRKVDESFKDAEYERLRTVPAGDMSETEYEYFKMRSRQRLGLMAVDFVALFERGDRSQDPLLRDGDVVNILPRKTYVTLAGQVALPGNVPFEAELQVEDYIARGGGYSWKASKGSTVVIRASTGEWIPKGQARRIGPGDTIWVPEKPDRDYYALFKDTLTVVAQLATVYLVVKTSTN